MCDTDGVHATALALGIPEGTIRSWRSKDQHKELERVPPPSPELENESQQYEGRQEALANRYGRLVDGFLSSAEGFLRMGKPREAKEAALGAAIATDKAQLLSGHATSRRDSRSVTASLSPGDVKALVAGQQGFVIPSDKPADLPLPVSSTERLHAPADGGTGDDEC